MLPARRERTDARIRPVRATLPGGDVRVDTLSAAILNLQRLAGNNAVTSLLSPLQRQKDVGWTEPDDTEKGRKWNLSQHEVGDIHRLPLEGLAHGLNADAKKGKGAKAGIPGLTSESADGRAIVLVPKGIQSSGPDPSTGPKVNIVIFLHGFTEDAGSRPFAGWRALNPDALELGPKASEDEKFVHSLRQGLPHEEGQEDDVAPVRDVALDQAEQQLQESGNPQTVMILPQGGLVSNFGSTGKADFDPGPYAAEVVTRLQTLKMLNDTRSADDLIGRISMAGHSGAGATLAKLALASVAADAAAKRAAKRAKPGEEPEETPPPPLTGDLVIYDAPWRKGKKDPSWQLDAFIAWAKMRLNNDLEALKGMDESEKPDYLRQAPKLRGYYSTGKHGGSYESVYKDLQAAIDGWFKIHGDELGHFAGCLRENFNVDHPIPVSHEELMRGVPAGEARGNEGTIRDALVALDPGSVAPGGVCPPLPASAQPDKKPEKAPAKKKHGHAEKEEEKELVGTHR